MKSYQNDTPVYSHNPYHDTRFPLLVLDVQRKVCRPFNEGFRMLHWHQELQFVYVRKGLVRFRLWEQEYQLGEGCCMFINCNVLHHITGKEDCSYHSFLIPPRMLGFFPDSIMEEETVQRFSGNPLLPGKCFLPEREEDQAVLKALLELDTLYFQEKGTGHWEYRVSLKLARLWLEAVTALENAGEEPFSVREKDHERIQKLLDFVHRNYDRRLSLQEISAAGNVSRTETLRCFKQYTGFSPYQYLQNYRLQAAASFLETTQDSVTEIALRTCFPSASAFITAFRRMYGMTPKKYREEKKVLY